MRESIHKSRRIKRSTYVAYAALLVEFSETFALPTGRVGPSYRKSAGRDERFSRDDSAVENVGLADFQCHAAHRVRGRGP